MPTPSDHRLLDQDLLDPDTRREDSPKRKSLGRKSQGRSKRRHEAPDEDLEKDGGHKSQAQHITPSPSPISQLPKSSSTSQTNLSSNLDPSLEAYSDPPSEQRPQPARGAVIYGSSPPDSKAANVGGTPLEGPPATRDFSHVSPPSSPRAAYRRKLQQKGEYQGFGGFIAASPPGTSLNSPHGGNPIHPPPPQYSQSHFYGAPEVDFGKTRQPAKYQYVKDKPRCTFDSFPLMDQRGSVSSQEVLLVGRDYGLDIFKVQKKALTRIGCISNVRRSIVNAKIIPSLSQQGNSTCGDTFIALIIHGPYANPRSRTGGGTREGVQEEFDASESMIQALQIADAEYYQTTVEVYTLKDSRYITTLFASPRIEPSPPKRGDKLVPPPLFGALSVQARGSFLTVSSGVSGEVYIYKHHHMPHKGRTGRFDCIGKVWTTVTSTHIRSSSMSSRESGQVQEDDDESTANSNPSMSLSARWLAFVPPNSSSQNTIHGLVAETQSNKIPGVHSHTAPEPPPVTCHLNTPSAESFVNRIARDATQEFVKGAKWIGSQGLQAWNRYWAKPADTDYYRNPGVLPGEARSEPPAAPPYFPPTHAQDNLPPNARNGPALVSILDLEKLSHSQDSKETIALQPLATFPLLYGCSALSFAPNGIHLFTASSKGDLQQIWDLMRMIQGESGRTAKQDAALEGPLVREIARFTRITEARIMDIAWTRLNGDRLALATDNGTVHIYDLPPSAFHWPPLRRVQRAVSGIQEAEKPENKASDLELPENSSGGFGSAFGVFTGKTKPLFSAVRGRTASAGNTFTGLGNFSSAAGAGAKGGKAVAAGINRSFTTAASGTINTIRHLGENRIILPGHSKSNRSGCMSWMTDKNESLLAVTGSSVVRIHGVRQSTNSSTGKRRPSAVGSKPVEHFVPHASYERPSPPQSLEENSPSLPPSFWLPLGSRPSSRVGQEETHPLSYAEIESHAPYQPFHTDRRVGFYVYDEESTQDDAHHLDKGDAWAFGEPIAATKLSLGPGFTQNEEMDEDRGGPFQMESIVQREGNQEEGQQILVTTRRRRRKKGDAVADDDGEFFEDDLEVVDFAQERV